MNASAVLPSPRRWTKEWRALAILGAGLLLTVLAWQRLPERSLPPGFIAGPVRVEADRVDIATRFPGRLRDLLVLEGDPVDPGQVLAHMDQEEPDTRLARVQEELDRAEAALSERQHRLAAWTGRSRAQATDGPAGVPAGSRFRWLEERVRALQDERLRMRARAEAASLTSPVKGLVHSRLANPGETLPAGGRTVTLLDLDRIVMEGYLPARHAGGVQVGSEARILLEAEPDQPIPAKVSWVAPSARLSLQEGGPPMFRILASVPLAYLRTRASQLGSGLRGTAYFRLDAARPWPGRLAGPGLEP